MADKCACVNIGAFKHPIDIIENLGDTRKVGGGRDAVWKIKFSTSAKITPSQKNDLLESQNLQQQTSHKITIRYRDGITSNMRIRFKGRFMFIKSLIDIDERNKFIEIKALESDKAEVPIS